MKKYTGNNLNEIAFPLGGIGAGSISLSGRGELVDWEIFNKPNKGYQPRFTFFSIRTKQEDESPVFRVLQGELAPPYQGRSDRWGWGPARDRVSGLPHMRRCDFEAIWPIAKVNLSDPDVPLDVTLEAFTPMWPSGEFDASLPAAFFRVHLSNPTKKKIDASVMFNMVNPAGWPEESRDLPEIKHSKDGFGFAFFDGRKKQSDTAFGNVAVVTDWPDRSYQADHLFENHDYPGYFDLLERFTNNGRLRNRTNRKRGRDRLFPTGALAMHAVLEPSQKVVMPLIISWHRGWVEKTWKSSRGDNPNFSLKEKKSTVRWKPWYATQFSDAWQVAKYAVKNHNELYAQTRSYVKALDNTSISGEALDAVSSQISTLKTPTVLRLTDGTLWGWEGCAPDTGVCWGSANHVWGFAQAAPYLFGGLDRTMLESFYQKGAFRKSDGRMSARVDLPLGSDSLWVSPASDGQFSMILRMYRSWQLSGDDNWLAKYWPRISKSLEYAFTVWDTDQDGLMEQPHDHTYDGVFTSAEPQSQMLYLAAIRACQEMAKYLGKGKKAEFYRKLFESGSVLTDQNLFNGEYYRQDIKPGQSLKGQLANGCLIDQLQGQWHATNLGLGYLTKPSNIRKAVAAIFKYNFMNNGYRNWTNRYRAFALNDEKGAVICTWPYDDRPKEPFLYADETMVGFEYQLACLLIQEGFVSKGLKVAKAIRDRFDGHKRNPWNEFECGSHYARSMASYGLLLSLSGFEYSAVEKHIGFDPKTKAENFSSFFSVPGCWGVFRQHNDWAEIEIMGGRLSVKTFKAGRLGVFDVSQTISADEKLKVENNTGH